MNYFFFQIKIDVQLMIFSLTFISSNRFSSSLQQKKIRMSMSMNIIIHFIFVHEIPQGIDILILNTIDASRLCKNIYTI